MPSATGGGQVRVPTGAAGRHNPPLCLPHRTATRLTTVLQHCSPAPAHLGHLCRLELQESIPPAARRLLAAREPHLGHGPKLHEILCGGKRWKNVGPMQLPGYKRRAGARAADGSLPSEADEPQGRCWPASAGGGVELVAVKLEAQTSTVMRFCAGQVLRRSPQHCAHQQPEPAAPPRPPRPPSPHWPHLSAASHRTRGARACANRRSSLSVQAAMGRPERRMHDVAPPVQRHGALHLSPQAPCLTQCTPLCWVVRCR